MTSAADLTPAPGLRSVLGQLPSFARRCEQAAPA